MELDQTQRAAVELMCSAPFCIVTGGPGVGKTTTLRVALDRLDAQRQYYALAAPTGKAAKRMSEATGRDASTIHRLLKWTPRGWLHHADNPLPFDAVFVDESSMLDTELAAALADAVGPDTRLVLIGDANQLPSVGPGRVLADLVESDAVPVARLTTVHRAAAQSWVCRNAPRVLAGERLELEECPDFRFVESEGADGCAAIVSDLMARPELADAQVLIPQRTTLCGVEAVNKALQAKINPPSSRKPEWKVGDRLFRLGDRVIQTRNDYDIEVFNGEVGRVVGFSEEPAVMTVDFGDRQANYGKMDAVSLDLAYALTVHKSQGSEFAWVICVVHSAHTYMLTRQLFYTAITRAKKGVILVGNRQGIAVATSPKAPPKRNTGLVARMREVSPVNGGGCPGHVFRQEAGVAAPVDHVDVPGGSISTPAASSGAAGDEIPW